MRLVEAIDRVLCDLLEDYDLGEVDEENKGKVFSDFLAGSVQPYGASKIYKSYHLELLSAQALFATSPKLCDSNSIRYCHQS